jgi:tetratricopeptide (TPR) repeat protein
VQGRYAEAEALLKRALKIDEAKLGIDHPDVATSLSNLARLYAELGRYAEAEPLYQRSLKIRETKLGPDHPDVAISLDNLAFLYYKQGRYAEAEPLNQRSLKILETKLGPDHPDVGTSLHGLAGLYQSLGRYAEAEPLYQRCLKIAEARFGSDHPDVATSLNDLAVLYRNLARYVEAEPLLRRSLKIQEAKRGFDHPEVATCLINLAGVYAEQDRYAEAEPLFKRGLEIDEAKLGPDHPKVATSLINLAFLYYAQGRYAEAEPLYKRGFTICVAKLGPDHPNVATIMYHLAVLHATQRQWTEAMEATDHTRHIRLRHIVRVLPALAEKEQLTYLKATDESDLHFALSLALSRSDDRAAVLQSAGWVLNGKGLAHQTLAELALLARGGEDPAAARLVAQLRDIRNRLAAMTIANPRPGRENDRKRELARLDEQERELSKKLGQVTGRPTRDDPWVEPDAVRKALPAEAIQVEIARFRVFDFRAKDRKKEWQPPHYAAWLIPAAGRGEVHVIDLGEAKPIEDAVAAARKALQPELDLLRSRGEPDAEQQVRKPLQHLARLVLHPLLPHIGLAKRWVISPDAALWLIPWGALPLPDGRYAIEEHLISYVVSGRDLVADLGPPASERPIVLADPDYDLDPVQARSTKRRVLQQRSEPVPETLLALRGSSRSLAGATFARLPGTAGEAEAILPRLASYTGVEPRLYTGPEALEAVFKAVQRPRLVILSTHGFFLEEPETKPADHRVSVLSPDGGRSKPGAAPPTENPLLRCGLVLAGANQRGQASGPDDEDGILTGLEIVGTDLRGTELVVLSACETAVGQVRNGEGVAGLRQAFQLAGAQAVVASLWQVPDKDTARLMVEFFDNLAAGQDRAAAMRHAQLALMASRRERYGAAHPFFWAAFTVTGDLGPSWKSETSTEDVPRELASLGPAAPRPEPKDESAEPRTRGLGAAGDGPQTGAPKVSGSPPASRLPSARPTSPESNTGRWAIAIAVVYLIVVICSLGGGLVVWWRALKK